MLLESAEDQRPDTRRQNVLGSDLEDAGPGGSGQREDSGEVEIVSEKLRGIGEGRLDVFLLEVGIGLQDLLFGATRGE